MFSRIIAIHPSEIEQWKKKEDNSRPFSHEKDSKKKGLPQNLKKGSLDALKELLFNQKTSVGATPTFSNPFREIAPTEMRQTSAIEPSAQVSQLFDHLVETLIMVKNEGIDETTFFLDGDAFASSIFKGAQITITEYSTAPKIFNIQFAAGPETLAFFEAHASELVSALRQGNFGFGVNRLDTSLLSEDEKHTPRPVKRPHEKEKNRQ